MKICRCLSGCLFAMASLAVPLSPAQEAAGPVAPVPAAAPALAPPTTASSPGEAGQNESPSTQATAQQQQIQQHADAERIVLLEARVATLERELQQLRTAMRAAGAALSGAAAGGDVGDAALANRGAMAPRMPSASNANRVPPLSDEGRQRFLSLSEAGRQRYMNEMRARADELSKSTPEVRATIFKETLERALQMDAADAGRPTSTPAPDANANAIGNASANTAAPVPTPATADTPKGERTGFTSLPPAARARFVEELRERQNEFANASPEDRQAMVKETMERAQRAAADEARNNNSGGNTTPPTAPMPIPAPVPAPVPTLDSAGRAPLPSLPTPTPPMAARDASTVTDAATSAPASGNVMSADASRQRFEALSEGQRHRFIEEMRRNREKLANATPAEREVIMHEALTKVEKEAGTSAAPSGAAEKTETQSPPQPQQLSKPKPAEGKKK